MSAHELDILQIKRFYHNQVPAVGAVEYVEDATNMHRVKRYEYDGTNWQFKEYRGRCELVVVPPHSKQYHCDSVVNMCPNPKRGAERVIKALLRIANNIAKGDAIKAIYNIQHLIDNFSMDFQRPPRKRTAYQEFLSKTLIDLKTTHPYHTQQERFSLAVQAWKNKVH